MQRDKDPGLRNLFRYAVIVRFCLEAINKYRHYLMIVLHSFVLCYWCEPNHIMHISFSVLTCPHPPLLSSHTLITLLIALLNLVLKTQTRTHVEKSKYNSSERTKWWAFYNSCSFMCVVAVVKKMLHKNRPS